MGRVAVIGAGIAGLAAAQALRAMDMDVAIFEKSRGLGGRMATRRAGDIQFDHGVQYVTARGEAFAAEIARWAQAGAAAPWRDGAFVGAPQMTAPARLMAQGLEVVTEALVAGLERRGRRWSVLGVDGAEDSAFDAVIVAAPAPQAAAILKTGGVDFPSLQRVRFNPCWALMAAFDEERSGPAEALAPDDPVLAWIAQDSSKPGRNARRACYVAHASAAWSKTHLEEAPEAIIPPMLASLKQLVGVSGSPTYVSAHRWRFALVDQPADEPCLFDPRLMVGACGDWCAGARVEDAYASGRAMAATLGERMGRS